MTGQRFTNEAKPCQRHCRADLLSHVVAGVHRPTIIIVCTGRGIRCCWITHIVCERLRTVFRFAVARFVERPQTIEDFKYLSPVGAAFVFNKLESFAQCSVMFEFFSAGHVCGRSAVVLRQPSLVEGDVRSFTASSRRAASNRNTNGVASEVSIKVALLCKLMILRYKSSGTDTSLILQTPLSDNFAH